MRNSLPKMTPSELSSRAEPVPSPWPSDAAGERRRAARRNGYARSAVPAEPRQGRLAARQRLLEAFISRTEIADCAQHALRWLADALGVPQSICLVKRLSEQSLVTVAVKGFKSSTGILPSISFDEWGHPLLTALTQRRPVFYAASSAGDRRRRPA